MRVESKSLLPIRAHPPILFFIWSLPELGLALYPVSPGFDVSCCRIVQPCLFTFREFDLHLGRDYERDFVLDGENVIDSAVVSFTPKMRPILGIDQLRSDSDAIAALANAAL